MCLFRSSSHFHLVEGKTTHIPSQQESNHFLRLLLLLMLNSGKWPQIFCYIQRNHPKKSKCRGSPWSSGKTLAGRSGDRSEVFLCFDFFQLVIARQPLARLAERMDKEIGCSVGFMQNSPCGFTFARILWDFRWSRGIWPRFPELCILRKFTLWHNLGLFQSCHWDPFSSSSPLKSSHY